jgi:hypothetical protein
METLYHIHFVGDFKIILFSWHKDISIPFVCNLGKKISEFANTEEDSLSKKTL